MIIVKPHAEDNREPAGSKACPLAPKIPLAASFRVASRGALLALDYNNTDAAPN